MKVEMMFLLILSFSINLLALDITTKDGTTYKDVNIEKISSVGVRIILNGESRFLGTIDITKESQKAIHEYKKELDVSRQLYLLTDDN